MLLLEIGVKTLYITVVFLEIGAVCYEAKNCTKQSAELQIYLNWLVRSGTCRHLKNCHFWAKQSAQLRIDRN